MKLGLSLILVAVSNLWGLAAANASVCDRSPVVVKEISGRLHKNCSAVTSEDLSQIDFMFLRSGSLNLSAGDLQGLSSLSSLEILSYKDPLTIESGAFDHLKNLQFLTIQSPTYVSVTDGMFRNLTKLKYLDLSFEGPNPSNELPPALFQGLDSLEELRLSFVEANKIPVELLHALTSLQKLYIQHCYVDSDTLPMGLFKGLNSLSYINFEDTSFKYFPGGIFEDLRSSLRKIFMSRTSLSDQEKQRLREELGWLELAVIE